MKRTLNSEYLLAAAVALMTLFVYLPALHNGFVEWDDTRYIIENPNIRTFDMAFIRWSFFGFHVSNWHPVTWIAHALDFALWGMNPLGHHLTSIALHAINTSLVVVLSLKLLETVRERSTQNGPASFLNNRTVLVAAGVTGLLFGIHPVHVESVAWVSERKDLLCALFFLLSIISFTNYAGGQESGAGSNGRSHLPNGHAGRRHFFTNKHYLLTLGFFILALLSKPMAVSLPVVLLILDWYPFGRIRSWVTFKPVGVEKLPFFALSLASSVLTILAQRAGGAIASTEAVPLSVRTLVAAKSLIAYMGQIIVPLNLIPFYPYPKDVSIISFNYLLAPALILGITAACVIAAKRQRAWLSAWAYYIVTLLPVLGIIQVGAQAMADRYMYLPSLGPFLIVGSIASWTSAKIQERWGLSRQYFFLASVLAAFAMLLHGTTQQIRIWQDSITFWSYELEKVPDANLAYVNRGIAFTKLGQFDKAIMDYTEAISRRPSDYKAFYSRGALFAKLNLLSQAIADYSAAIALNPSNYDAYNNRGVLYERLGQFDAAMTDYNTAISLNPSNYDAYVNRGLVYDRARQADRAIADFNRAISLNPNNADAYYNRGLSFSRMGRLDSAVADFDRAISLNPNDPDAYYNRGLAFQKMGQVDKANQDFMGWKAHSARR